MCLIWTFPESLTSCNCSRAVEKADNFSDRFHEIYIENQELKKIVRDYECVKAVLGREKVSGSVQMETTIEGAKAGRKKEAEWRSPAIAGGLLKAFSAAMK